MVSTGTEEQRAKSHDFSVETARASLTSLAHAGLALDVRKALSLININVDVAWGSERKYFEDLWDICIFIPGSDLSVQMPSGHENFVTPHGYYYYYYY